MSTASGRGTESPCSRDFRLTKNDWTNARRETRAEYMELARQCNDCPIGIKCLEQAMEDAPHSEGIWGGYLWRNGRAMDPLGIERGDMQSVHHRVYYERNRGKWRMEAQLNGVKKRVGYFDNEDDAGAAARAWELANGVDD